MFNCLIIKNSIENKIKADFLETDGLRSWHGDISPLTSWPSRPFAPQTLMPCSCSEKAPQHWHDGCILTIMHEHVGNWQPISKLNLWGKWPSVALALMRVRGMREKEMGWCLGSNYLGGTLQEVHKLSKQIVFHVCAASFFLFTK